MDACGKKKLFKITGTGFQFYVKFRYQYLLNKNLQLPVLVTFNTGTGLLKYFYFEEAKMATTTFIVSFVRSADGPNLFVLEVVSGSDLHPCF